MSTSGSRDKRVGMPLVDAEASPRRSRSSSHSPVAVPSPPAESNDNHVLSRSRSRVIDVVDRRERPVWRPHSDIDVGGDHGHGEGEYLVRISDYDYLFTCGSCRRMLSSSVYECSNGHFTCTLCQGYAGVNSCRCCLLDDCVRSRTVEEFLGRISFSCRNHQYGCEVFLLQHDMRVHESSCHYDPCFCPVPRCSFAGPAYALESHLATIHRWSVTSFRYGESFEASADVPAIYRCVDYGELFHLVSSREVRGTALSMICIRPDNACKQEFSYELKMPDGGPHHLQIQSIVWNTSLRYGIGEGADMFLLVPDKLPGVEDGCACAVEVCIHRVEAPGS